MRLVPILAAAVLVALPACRTAGTYSERGEHVELMKDILEDYAAGEWYAYGTAYSDSVRFFVNATTPMTLEERLASHRALRDVFEDVAIGNPLFGEVHNTDGETWVLTWGSWTGRVTGSETRVTVPIHLASQFAGGKVVQEWAYVNLSPLENAIIESGAVFGDPDAPPPDSTLLPAEPEPSE